MTDYEKIQKDSTQEGLVSKEQRDGVIVFHVKYRQNSPTIRITEGGTPNTEEEYKRAIEGIHNYNEFYHAHDCFFLVYVINGTDLEIVEEEPIMVTENDLLLITPYSRHHNFRPPTSQVVFFHLDPEMMLRILVPAIQENIVFSDFFSDFLTDRHTRKSLFFKGCMDRVRPLLQQIVHEYVGEELLYHSCLQYLLGELMIELARTHSFQSRHFSDAMSDQMQQVVRYITVHYRDCTLESVSRTFSYNPAYLSRKIHQYSGKTYSQLLTDYRLNIALLHLRQEQTSIEKAAEICGFHEISTFYKAFRKKFGYSPRQYLQHRDSVQ